jgi:hypothetical protein
MELLTRRLYIGGQLFDVSAARLGSSHRSIKTRKCGNSVWERSGCMLQVSSSTRQRTGASRFAVIYHGLSPTAHRRQLVLLLRTVASLLYYHAGTAFPTTKQQLLQYNARNGFYYHAANAPVTRTDSLPLPRSHCSSTTHERHFSTTQLLLLVPRTDRNRLPQSHCSIATHRPHFKTPQSLLKYRARNMFQ